MKQPGHALILSWSRHRAAFAAAGAALLLALLSGAPAGAAPSETSAATPVPVFIAPVAFPSTVNLGDAFTIRVSVRNDGLLSDNGRISVSFPELTGLLDGNRVTTEPSGDFPGYIVTGAHTGTMRDINCDPISASYLSVEYVDADWRPFALETNTLGISVRPATVGPFHFYVRSTMHDAMGAPCDFVNGVPAGGESGYTDQQGWTVRRFTVTVVERVTLPAPVFPQPVVIQPTTIGLGQTFTISVTARNDGFGSNDGRIVVGFPTFGDPGDAMRVGSPLVLGDSPGYREFAAGASLLDSDCHTTTASYLVVEYADANWLSQETNTLNLTVGPASVGEFTFEVRSTMRAAGGSFCQWENAVPGDAGPVALDQQRWAVRRYTVTVLPPPPAPSFTFLRVPPQSITLGQPFEISAAVINGGSATDDGRIVVSFPSFTGVQDAQWVSLLFSSTDGPGYREILPGSLIMNPACVLVPAFHVSAEYADAAWLGDNGETNVMTLQVIPQALGEFRFTVRSTMRWAQRGACFYINGLPGSGASVVDQYGWTAHQYSVVVTPASPPPLFTLVSGIPPSIVLGEEFTITASVHNDGPWTNDGRISIGFPAFTGVTDGEWTSSVDPAIDYPGYVESPAGSPVADSTCRPVTANYLMVEYQDAAFDAGETNTLTVRLQPRAAGTFYVDVRASVRDLVGGECVQVTGLPAGGGAVTTDVHGWRVRRIPVTVHGPPGPFPQPTVAWEPLYPAGPAGPGSRSGASAVFRPSQDAMVIYGGSNPVYHDDVWQLSLAPGGAWSKISPGGSVPLRRIMHSMILNPIDDQLVIFGGLYDDFLNDLIVVTLTGQQWWFHNPGQGTPPGFRGGHTATYDPVRNRMLVIGGYARTLLNDVWEYAPPGVGTWRQLTALGTPMPGRVQHAAVYDPVRDRVVVIGGDGGTFLNDVWALNLAGEPTWERLEPIGIPPTGRREHTAIYDPDGDRAIVYGGFDGVGRRGDLWSLSLKGTPEWKLLLSATPPPANRTGHNAIYDPGRHRMVVFGGQTGATQYSDEAWGLTLDITTPVAIALATTEVQPDLVRLTWSGEQVANMRAVLFRSSDGGGEWEDVGSPVVDGPDRLVFEDRDVRPGERYGYRLEVRADGEQATLDPVWITIPHPAVLSLAGASPNPSERGISVRFSLPGAEPATLELFDLRGRRIAEREVGSLGAGEHLVPLADRPGLPAGVYLVRLTHPRQVLTTKALVVR